MNFITFLLPWQCFTNDNITLLSLIIGWMDGWMDGCHLKSMETEGRTTKLSFCSYKSLILCQNLLQKTFTCREDGTYHKSYRISVTKHDYPRSREHPYSQLMNVMGSYLGRALRTQLSIQCMAYLENNISRSYGYWPTNISHWYDHMTYACITPVHT